MKNVLRSLAIAGIFFTGALLIRQVLLENEERKALIKAPTPSLEEISLNQDLESFRKLQSDIGTEFERIAACRADVQKIAGGPKLEMMFSSRNPGTLRALAPTERLAILSGMKSELTGMKSQWEDCQGQLAKLKAECSIADSVAALNKRVDDAWAQAGRLLNDITEAPRQPGQREAMFVRNACAGTVGASAARDFFRDHPRAALALCRSNSELENAELEKAKNALYNMVKLIKENPACRSIVARFDSSQMESISVAVNTAAVTAPLVHERVQHGRCPAGSKNCEFTQGGSSR